MAGKSWLRWYFAWPFVLCAVVGRLAIIVMRHYDPRPAWTHTSTSSGSDQSLSEMARVLDASPERLARDMDRASLRSNLSTRLVQLAHDAREGGAREVALAAYDADDANIHGDCRALQSKIEILKARAASTPQAEAVGLIVNRADALCGDAAL
jgi:hypothetical protein